MQRLLFTLFLFTLLTSPFTLASAWAAMALVPQTGQTTSYAPGDDGDNPQGVPWPNPRFSDNSNGTITDNLTGLVWLKNANCYGTSTWAGAISSANGLKSGACGLTDSSKAGDWRLPNRKELKSLISRQQANNATWLVSLGFSNVQADYYWSSSTYASNTDGAWGVSMFTGYVSNGNKATNYDVWPVRSGQ